MSLIKDIPMLLELYKSHQERLGHNERLFNIYEGELLPYVLEDLKNQLSPQAYEQIKHRVPPINTLKRLVDKLSKIYAKSPVREVEPKTDKEKKVLEFYTESYEINTNMSLANEFFNLFKYTLVEPYLDRGVPKLRTVPSDRFFVYSNDPVNPLRPTHLVKIMGTYKDNTTGKEHTVFYGYTDAEFYIFNDKEEVMTDQMFKIYGTVDLKTFGKNPYGRIPAVYINRSKHCLIPKCDTDTLQMTKLLPILLSDINFALMYQAFSIIYGIDIDEQKMQMSPNAFWRFKSDATNPDAKPQVGVIKAEVDSDKALSAIKAQLQFWLESRNIKPGAMGTLTVDNAASGIAKALDEMDTSEDRQKQVPYFINAEKELWDLTINYLHPVWMKDPFFQYRVALAKGMTVKTAFAEQRPMVDTSKVIDDQIKMIDKGMQSKAGGLKEIYPDMTEDQITERLQEADDERQDNPDQTGESGAGQDPGATPKPGTKQPA